MMAFKLTVLVVAYVGAGCILYALIRWGSRR